MTERLSDFLCTLALKTSYEGAARIVKNMMKEHIILLLP